MRRIIARLSGLAELAVTEHPIELCERGSLRVELDHTPARGAAASRWRPPGRALEFETSFDGLKLLGQILHRQGELRAARTAWERALAWGGDPASRAFVETLLRSLARPTGR